MMRQTDDGVENLYLSVLGAKLTYQHNVVLHKWSAAIVQECPLTNTSSGEGLVVEGSREAGQSCWSQNSGARWSRPHHPKLVSKLIRLLMRGIIFP